MKRPAIILAAAVLAGTAHADPLDCFMLSSNWTAWVAKATRSSNYSVVDTFHARCHDVLTSTATACTTGHYYTVHYRNPDGTWTQIPLPSKAQHQHAVICGSFKAVNLERTNLGGICGWRPGAPIEIVDILVDNPSGTAGPPPRGTLVGVRIKRWRFRCPPLVVGPGPGDLGS